MIKSEEQGMDRDRRRFLVWTGVGAGLLAHRGLRGIWSVDAAPGMAPGGAWPDAGVGPPIRNPSLETRATTRGILLSTRDGAGRRLGVRIPEPGATIWELVNGVNRPGDIAAALRVRCPALPGAAEEIVSRELDAMRRAGLIYERAPVWVLIRYA